LTFFTVAAWNARAYPMPANVFKEAEAKNISWYKYDFYPPVSLGLYEYVDDDPTGYWHTIQDKR